MALVNTINFLPRVFRTTTNQRFLGATMDHLATDAANLPINGYVGRTFAPTYKTGDNYVPETDALRKNYQLEPSVVVANNNGDIEFNAGYIDLLNSIKRYGGLIDNQQRLFGSETYSFDAKFDYDKFVNYYNYYWLPEGPAPVQIYGNQAPTTANYVVTRNTATGGYTFTGQGNQPNTQITLVRGGRYTFTVDQPGHSFWIQTAPGTSGVDATVGTISTRQIFGVTNNGAQTGTVAFQVPLATAQDFYALMPIRYSVDAAVTFKYNEIQNRLLSDFLDEYPSGLDGINNQLQNKTLVFVANDSAAEYWTTPAVSAPYTALDVAEIRPGDVIGTSTRVSAWKINLVAIDAEGSDYIIQLSPIETVDPREKIFVTSGRTYASNQFWLDDNLRYQPVPVITASANYLYYQDGSNAGFVGQIKFIDNATTTVDVEQDIIGKVGYTSTNGVVFTNGLKIRFDSLVTPASYANKEYYVDGVGTAIKLIAVEQLVPSDTVTDLINDSADYITINRGSQDRNAWSRSNRWFHKDVINATAEYNSTAADYGPNLPGRRPIIEFESNLQLYNYGRLTKENIDLITFDNTDAFGITIPSTRVQGQATATISGVTLQEGQRVVFANDYDINVANKIWVVTFISNLAGPNYINLIPAADNPVQSGENLLVTQGTNAGKIYRFDGATWFECQDKTALNQAPLFDLFDKDGYSFGDATVYPESTFAGNKIFGYYPGTGNNNDDLLGFPLRYQNFNNIGDIVFKNYYDQDSFVYTQNTETMTEATINCGTGYLVRNTGLDTQQKINIWVTNLINSNQYQTFTRFFDGRVIEINGEQKAFVQIDVLPNESASIPYVKTYKNNTLLVQGQDYELTKYGIYDIVIFTELPAVGDKLDVLVYSDLPSALAAYETPKNLDQNPLNEKISTISLGQIRTHYNRLIENTASNDRPTQDSYIKAQGGTLSQHSAPLVYAMTFLNDSMLNFVNGLDLAKKEYTRFKNKFLNLCVTLPGLDYNNPITGVDAVLQNINSVKNSSFPWYYSDMVPQGANYTTVTYTVLNARQTNYEISTIFDYTQLSNRAVLIWLNGEQLVLGRDYTFSLDVPSVIFTVNLTVGDQIVIRDYFDTDGNYIPETPSKLGLYPKSEPLIFEDSTYQTPTNVIRGHDGSLTPAFGDFRDQYLLELEKRIYNNIKSDYTGNIINLYDILPGRFRTTEYSRDEFNQILSQSFLQWAGANNVDYTTNEYFDANNPWTWNYEKFSDAVDNTPLQGSWRAIYQYWYDTDQPNLAPWQMLGFGFEPAWWQERYGPAPYTSGNFTLWEDLEAGYVWNNGDSYTDARFARPGLTSFIPVDSAGNLLPPTDIRIIQQFNQLKAGNNFTVGQQGPVETAWRRSSDYPFAIQMTLALAKPASYFGTQYDTSRFFVNTVTGQFTDVDNQKITPTSLKINGDTRSGSVTRTSGYVNWIADVIKNMGVDPVEKISAYLENFAVKLNYKIGGFTDKNMITVTAEQTTPGAVRAGVIVPDSNYKVYLNKSVPVSSATYSAVIIQKTQAGYSLTGYDTTNPFFSVLPSIANSNAEELSVNDVTVKLFQDTTNQAILIPYGTTYANLQQVADFLISYQRYLESQGFVFQTFDPDLSEVRNFRTGTKEFLVWSQQGWENGTILVVNPTADRLFLQSTGTVVDEITNTANSGRVLDQNFLPIKSTNFNLLRVESASNGNLFRITTLNGTGICFAKLNLIQYEHVLVFDNQTDFADIIYLPTQGTRQYRLKIAGNKTGRWTGALSASGYIYSDARVTAWQAGQDYQVGDIVTFNNNYYTALSVIPASTKFNLTDWAQIQEQDIKTGLLPSFGRQAQQFDNIYDIDQPPSNENLQLFSAGLIGFRPRTYFTDLGISVPNQTKFYQGFIKEKGTLNSITALTKANFNNVNGNIQLYEEWALKVGDYGDLDGNQFKEFILDQSVFNTNPVAFTLGNTYSTGNIIVNLQANANLALSNVYNSSNLNSVSTQLYGNRDKNYYATDLPTAGFVHLDDTDLQIFDINNYNQVPDVGVGSKIWVAKDLLGEWNVFRVSETGVKATQLTYLLDDFAQMSFDSSHDLAVGDLFVLKGFQIEYFNNAVLENFSTNYDGIYVVSDVINSLNITVQIKNTTALNNLIATSPVQQEADIYKMVSARIAQVTDIDSITPMQGWLNTDTVWVDTATNNGWGVYKFNRSWPNSRAGNIQYSSPTTNDQFGSQIVMASSAQYYYINNPGQKLVQVYANVNNQFVANVTVSNTEPQFARTVASQGNLLVIGSNANVRVYRHNDSTTANTIATVWTPNSYPTLGTAWTANTTFSIGTQIYNPATSNTYVTVGNVYASTFSSVLGNVEQVSWIPINSIISYNSNIYVTTGNVRTGNIFLETMAEKFAAISNNTRQIDVQAGNIILLQTLSMANLTGNITSVTISNDGQWIYVGGNNRVEAYTTTNSNWANIKYTYATALNNGGSFGNVLATNTDGTRLFVSAPLATNTGFTNNGNVYYYTRSGNTFTLAQTLGGQFKNNNAGFGTSLDVDAGLGNLFVGIPGSTQSGQANGAVEHYVLISGQYQYRQSLLQPRQQPGKFGTSISVSNTAQVVAVGSQGSASEETTVFDNSTTTIDTNSTQFIDSIYDSGTVYVFEPLINLANTAMITYSFAHELETGEEDRVYTGDNFGAVVQVAPDLILASCPNADIRYTANGEVQTESVGIVYSFRNSDQQPAWTLLRQQTERVDIDTINRTFLYNKSNDNIISVIDVVDPVKGRILSSVDQDIDYKTNRDPATYNAGTQARGIDLHWGPQQLGRIWWNLDTVRYIDYEQDALIYRLNHWGNHFPGSQIEIYEWTESTVLPSQYASAGLSGQPLYPDDTAYSTWGYVDQAGNVRLKYYFWVSNKDQANTATGKKNSTVAIASAIENPQNQNIPYATVLRNDTIALHNVKNLLTGKNTVLHLGSQNTQAGLIHSEYALVQEKSASGQLPNTIINKMFDSLCQEDAAGNKVPDPALPVSQRYGIEIRPRQTMFVDITAALKNLINLVNEKLYQYPVTQRKVLTLLNSEELPPSIRTGQYDLSVDTKAELLYVNTQDLSTGYKILVLNDPANLTKWAIYEWDGNEWAVPADGTRPRGDGTFGNWVQSYKTSLHWHYIDWYDQSFDPTQSVDITVADNLEFNKLALVPGTYIKVNNAGNDKFAIYFIDSTSDRITVGLESGTIQLDEMLIDIAEMGSHKEFRQILYSLRDEIFIDDLAADFNEIFFAMVKYALTEQKNIDWAFKTSFVSATQYIRKLEQFPSYIADNQDFYQDYINEVKPYRTILREFNINYQRNDEFGGDITDFDLAPYWDANINVYRSPSGEQSYDADLLNNRVYYDWKNNYSYGVVDVVVGAGGSGFVSAPQIVIQGGGGSGANAVAQIDAFGTLSNITIVDPGTGYVSSPTVLVNGTGTGAKATAVLRNVWDGNDTGHNVIRSVRTNIKFDRVTYAGPTANIFANLGLTSTNASVMWDEVTAGQILAANTVINLDGALYQLESNNYTVSANIDFPIANVRTISAGDLETANERIVAYRGNIDLSATTDGIDYPGVVVSGSNYFAYDTVTTWTANTDILIGTQISNGGNIYVVTGNVYAAYFANVAGSVTQVTAEKIDAIIQSRYPDDFGIDTGNITVDGGAYVDTFSSHAPQELVPGRMYDSLNLKVFSNLTPGTNDYAFRLFDNMSQRNFFYRISNNETTTLSRDLLITDHQIYVTDATQLPSPNRVINSPGVIFINGEKIHYYRNYAREPVTAWSSNTVIATDALTSFDGNIYLTTGNVFATNTPWTANTIFAANSYVYYSGSSYEVVGNVNAPYFANIQANTRLLYNNEDSGFASISSNVTLIANTVNVLGQIRRAVDGTAPNDLNTVPWTTNTSIPTGSYLTYLGNTYVTTGNVYEYHRLWTTRTVFATNSYFHYGANVYQATGNVYATSSQTFANVSGNAALIATNRVDSGFFNIQGNLSLLYTGTNSLRHLANTRVVDASAEQVVPDVVVANAVALSTTANSVTANVTIKLTVGANISANIGDFILTNTANLRLLETVSSSNRLAVISLSGNIFAGTSNLISIVDSTTGNSSATLANVSTATVLGSVSQTGTVTIIANTAIKYGNIWYGNVTDRYYGDTLLNSTTAQADFLKLSPGYVP